MTKRYSIAEVGQNLSAVAHGLEWRARIGLTHRDKLVAEVLSTRDFERVSAPRGHFWDACEAFPETVCLPQPGIDATVFEGVQDRSPGRGLRLQARST